jgi:LysR family nod box-dependent transcriptional activator
MRLNRLDLNLLIALDALLTERSITRAAEHIHLSQSATSGALARLRVFFDDELLVRVGSQMMPTPLGESLAAPVHNILLQIQVTVDHRLEFKPLESQRRFRILLSDYSSSTFMSQVAKKLADLAPNMQLEFFAPTNNPGEKLEQGEVDFLIMPENVLSEGHPKLKLFDEDFVCIGCRDNPALGQAINLDQYLDMGHVSVRFGSRRVRSQDQIYLQDNLGIEPRMEIITSTFTTIPQFLLGTTRIATVYRKLAEDWMTYLPLKMVPVPVAIPSLPWGLQWHKSRDLDLGIKWLRDLMISVANERSY